jgi:flagellar basal body-associated protein FliL
MSVPVARSGGNTPHIQSTTQGGDSSMSIVTILIIVVVVLLVLGIVGRGRF